MSTRVTQLVAACASILVPFAAHAATKGTAVVHVRVEYPTLGIPFVDQVVSLANVTGSDRVHIDGRDVGGFALNQESSFQITQGPHLVILARRDVAWQLGFNKIELASNVVHVRSHASQDINIHCNLTTGEFFDCRQVP